MNFEQVLAEIKPYQVRHVLLTGGEPLLQRNTLAFIQELKSAGYDVSIETHGEVSIEAAAKDARIIMDIKTPGSGMSRGFYKNNLKFLKPNDEIKFVITSPTDYEWARTLVQSGELKTNEILFSPALPAENTPGKIEGMQPRALAEKILADKLPVRFQLQLHKLLWGENTRGVWFLLSVGPKLIARADVLFQLCFELNFLFRNLLFAGFNFIGPLFFLGCVIIFQALIELFFLG